MDTLPAKGLGHDEVLRLMDGMAEKDARWREGRTFSLVYHAGEAHTRFLKEAHGRFFSENALNPMAFRSLRRFEAEVVRMTARLLHGGPDTVGVMTSGGTESILLAVKAYRDRARARFGFHARPAIIAPESVHVAFDKAAEYFDVTLRHAPLGPDHRVDLAAVRRMIDRHTILLVGSAPCYPFGVVDDLAGLAAIAAPHGLPLHVDACLGGFLLPFAERLGRPVRPWDFRLPGVTSISADAHKYGYAAKGASVLLYRDMDLLQHQFFVHASWPGGLFASPGLLGTRPGGSIAAAWAAMHALGESGYLDLARQVLATTDRMLQGIAAIPALEVLGKPDLSVLAYRSRDPAVDIYVVGDGLEKRGWHVDRQQRPPSLHAMITPAHATVIDRFLADLRAAVDEARAHPERAGEGGAAMYGLAARMPIRGLVTDNLRQMMRTMYGPRAELPDLAAEGPPKDPLVRIGLQALAIWDQVKGLYGRIRRGGAGSNM